MVIEAKKEKLLEEIKKEIGEDKIIIKDDYIVCPHCYKPIFEWQEVSDYAIVTYSLLDPDDIHSIEVHSEEFGESIDTLCPECGLSIEPFYLVINLIVAYNLKVQEEKESV